MSALLTATLPAGLPTHLLTDEEARVADGLLERLHNHQQKNALMSAYYEGKQRVRDLGIAVPPHLKNLESVVGWPGMAVDVLEERLDHDGWTVPGSADDRGLSEIVDANYLQTEFGMGHLDALTYGTAFGVAARGSDGLPDPLVMIVSPTRMTGTWDRLRRGIRDALLVSTDGNGDVESATLYLPGVEIRLRRDRNEWQVEDRLPNPIGRPPVVRLVNRPRASDTDGRSEITRAVRAYTDNAVRTVLGMEIAREFFSSPQRWVMGADESAFQGPDGQPKTAWDTYLGRMLALSKGEGEEMPEVGQFPANSPAPYLEQLRGLAQMMSAESALPIAYLGLAHDANPASADAALVSEARLNKRAERRQTSFGRDEGELMRMALWIRDGRDPGVTPRPNWRPAATPTLAAAADATLKLVQGHILPPDSQITQKRIGLTETDRALLADERRRNRATATLSALEAAAEVARADSEVAALADVT